MKEYKILTINPGSTSTKIALFKNSDIVYQKNISHDADRLERNRDLEEELTYREEEIQKILKEDQVSLDGLDACVGRGGGLLAMEGGTYRITQLMLEHSIHSANGVIHPANLGVSLAQKFADEYGAQGFVVNPPDVDELWDLARMTGVKGVYRVIHLHALNQKEIAIRHAEKMGKKYEECNFIVAHIGGGISVAAHKMGKMIDGFDNVGGEGPMAPTRCGAVSVMNVADLCREKTEREIRNLCMKNGGFVSHLGISDAREVVKRAESGDQYAELLWNTMIYQIEKAIGAMAAVLKGNIDAILLSGGMVYSNDLVKKIEEGCGNFAPIYAYPGEFEMEAMEAGAYRVLSGNEQCKEYTGKNRFQGFNFANKNK